MSGPVKRCRARFLRHSAKHVACFCPRCAAKAVANASRQEVTLLYKLYPIFLPLAMWCRKYVLIRYMLRLGLERIDKMARTVGPRITSSCHCSSSSGQACLHLLADLQAEAFRSIKTPQQVIGLIECTWYGVFTMSSCLRVIDESRLIPMIALTHEHREIWHLYRFRIQRLQITKRRAQLLPPLHRVRQCRPL